MTYSDVGATHAAYMLAAFTETRDLERIIRAVERLDRDYRLDESRGAMLAWLRRELEGRDKDLESEVTASEMEREIDRGMR